jgi:uncharacterized protein YjbI with pentapeptide repeats
MRTSIIRFTIAIGVIVLSGSALVLAMFFAAFGNPLDGPWLRLTKQCSNCRFSDAYSFAGADLEGARFARSDLSTIDLRRANLKNADLSQSFTRGGTTLQLNEADLQQATLVGVHLSYSNLSGANLQNANLQGAILEGSNLHNTNFQNANLTGARLTGAMLLNTNFTGANLSQAKLCFLSSRSFDLTGANLSGTQITVAGTDDFTPDQKQALKLRGAIPGGSSDNCYGR